MDTESVKRASRLLLIVGVPVLAAFSVACALFFREGRLLAFLGLGVLATAWFVTACWLNRVKQMREIARFAARPAVVDIRFLDALGIEPSTKEAEIALAVRTELARLGEIPPESICASTRFYPDLQDLPFYDSPDWVEFVLMAEEIVGFHVSDDAAHGLRLPGLVPDLTVGDMVRDVLSLYRQGRRP